MWLYDPATGNQRGTVIEVDPAVLTQPPLLAHTTRTGVNMYDYESLDLLAGPLDAEGVESAALVGDSIVGFSSDGTVVTFGSDGSVGDTLQFESDIYGDFSGRAELLGSAAGSDVGIISSGTSVGFTADGGQLAIVWELEGRVGAPQLTDRGPVSVTREIDALTGEINLLVIDAETGETLAVTDMGTTRESDPLVVRNGFIVPPEVGNNERIVSLIDYDGHERWSHTLAPADRWIVADHLFATVSRDVGHSTVTVFG